MSWTRFQIGFDIHGDMQDVAANKVFFDFAKIWKPQIRICGGDLFDFRPLRRGASEDERRESLRKDFEMGCDWLQRFAPQYFIKGNHDARAWDLAEKGSGIAQDFAIQGVQEIEELCKKLKCQTLPYNKRDGVLRIGHLKVLHGFSTGLYAVRNHALIYGSCLLGHCHSIDRYSIPGLERRMASTCGCLCRLDMDYNSRQMNTLRQAHGFSYGVIDSKSGYYHAWQAESIDGKWIIPSDFKEF